MRAFTLLTVLLAATLSHGTSAQAQEEPAPTRVILPLDLWAELAKGRGGPNALRIVVDGENCGGFGMDARANSHFTGEGDPFWVPSGPGCLREGAPIQFFQTTGERLSFRTVMTPGADITISSVDFEPGNVDGATVLGVRPYPADVPQAQRPRYIDVTADWKECGRIDLENPRELSADGFILYRLDGAGLPAQCSKDGTKLRLLTDTGGAFWQKPGVIRGGTTYQFEFGPEPPHGWPSKPTPRPAFWWLPWTMAGLAVAGIATAATVPRVRRHRRGY